MAQGYRSTIVGLNNGQTVTNSKGNEIIAEYVVSKEVLNCYY